MQFDIILAAGGAAAVVVDAVKIRYRNKYYTGIISGCYNTKKPFIRCFRFDPGAGCYIYDCGRFFPPAAIHRARPVLIPVLAADLETIAALDAGGRSGGDNAGGISPAPAAGPEV